MKRNTRPCLGAAALATALAFSSQLFANPSGGAVTHGNATISVQGNTLTIQQQSRSAIIEWDSFSIASGEITRFQQLDSNSAALNRVITGNPSLIHGSLLSNGKVLLINPNGILVGPAGRIEAGGGFLASTLDVADEEFMRGGDLEFSGTSQATVANLGRIVAQEGDVMLLSAGDVTNAGTIEAPQGTVGLATGTSIVIKSSGDERMVVKAGSAGGTVDHTGAIRAAQAELKALGTAESMAINAGGLIEATGVSRKGGRVLLTAGGGTLSVSSKISARKSNGDGGEIRASGGMLVARPIAGFDASGNSGGVVELTSDGETQVGGKLTTVGSDGTGGRIEVTGETVELIGNTELDASGTEGGGEIFVGGGFQGNDDSLRNAVRTTVGSGALLRADANGETNGGTIIVWADDTTIFGGHASVSAENGDGGFVEISGKQNLFYRGSVDLSSDTGDYGTLLLDPDNIIIVDGAAGGAADSGELNDGVILGGEGGPGSTFTITTGDIAAVGGNVLLQANQNITANAGTNINASGSIAFTGGNAINLNNVRANGSIQIVGASVGFNSLDTSGDQPGENGGNVTIIATNGNIIGNFIDADGANGSPGSDGGKGGDIVLFDQTGGQVINIANGIDNRGGNGGIGSAQSRGGNGGRGGSISAGNGNTPSSVTIPVIRYGGGNGGDGNPPGQGGEGGRLFVNNNTNVPNNQAPSGVDGDLLGGQNFVYGPGFNSRLGNDIDLNFFSQEFQSEIFGTHSQTDTGRATGGSGVGAFQPNGITDFQYNGTQFPNDDVAIYDRVSERQLRDFAYFSCGPYDLAEAFFLGAALGIPPGLIEGGVEDFLDELDEPGEQIPAEDAAVLEGSGGNPEVSLPAATRTGSSQELAVIPGARREKADDERAGQGNNGNGRRQPRRNNGNPPALNRALDARDDAQENVAAAEDDEEEAKDAEKKAEEDLKDAEDEQQEAEDDLADRQEDAAKLQKKLDDVLQRLQRLLDGGAEALGDDAEARRVFAEQAQKLSREAEQLQRDLNQAKRGVANAEQRIANAKNEVAAAKQDLAGKQGDVAQAEGKKNAAERDRDRKQEVVDKEIRNRNRVDRIEKAQADAEEARARAAVEKRKADEIARIKEANQKIIDEQNKAANERRAQRDKAFENADIVDVPVERQAIDDGKNIAQVVQQKLVEDGKVATLEDSELGESADNPLDSPDARSFDSPIIIELFERKEQAEEDLRFTFLNDDIELSIREFVDESRDVDFFLETRFNDRGDKILITQTIVDKKTGDFVTAESKHDFVDVEERAFRAVRDIGNEVGDILSGFRRGEDGQPDSRVVRGNIFTGEAGTE